MPGCLSSERRASWVYYAVIPEALHGLSALLNLEQRRVGRCQRMTETTTSTSAAPAVVGKLSTLDRFLPVWIGVAMAPACCWAVGSPG